MTQSKIRFTYQDYKNMPESETKHYELLEGELVLAPSPSEQHQSISGNLFAAMFYFIKAHDLGKLYHPPFDVVMGENVFQPDITYVSKKRSGIINPEEIRGVPDIVIEILSSGTAMKDRTYKRTLYARHGVPEYWLLDPEKETVEVLRLGEKEYETKGVYRKGEILTSPSLKGFRLKLTEVF